jgi:N-acetylglucosaminyldiphosphoundecaprenol N-acetyl-beta-D-mannosaminyltransferase
MKNIESVNILGVDVNVLTEAVLHDYVKDVIVKKERALISNVNIHAYNVARSNPWMFDFFKKSNLIFCDGGGVALGAKILGHHLPGRITYADSIWDIAKLSAQEGFSFYFLGAKPGVAEKAAQKLQAVFPALKVMTHHGYFDKSKNSSENQKIVDSINKLKPNILMVGFGMPIQEKWLYENWNDLQNVNVAYPIGALFDFVSEEVRRGPRWMLDNNMEWLARLLIEPKRLFWRYFWGNPLFFTMILQERLRRRS